MEQHPVPRNISGFQFHLIGDMTVRQFGYLAAGVFIAYLAFRFAPFPPILRFPLAGICALGGFALAFLPIQDRPLDKWLVLFFRSITSPTQFLWHKEGILPDILAKPAYAIHPTTPAPHVEAHQDANEKLRAYLATVPAQPHDYINQHEKKYLDATLSLFHRLDVPVSSSPISSPPNANKIAPPVSPPSSPPLPIPKPTVSAQPVLPISTPKPFASDIPTPTVAPSPNQPSSLAISTSDKLSANNAQSRPKDEMSDQLSQLLAEKERLAKELETLKKQTAQFAQPASLASRSGPAGGSTVVHPQPSTVPQQPTIVTIASQAATSEFGLPNLPQTPNLVIGVVKDPGRKILPNVILTIKDGKGMPIRALKTNKLGQFETATLLPNGTYLLEIEDPLKRYTFDTAQITLSGKIFLPIEITAKGQKEIMREKLTRELFGNAGVNANI